ncbi:MAG TPA: hypothetical protein VLX58_08185 [Bryobacteraceae bacterium]|nr:hypothetical protein [Bryobacteraceae bacterium]
MNPKITRRRLAAAALGSAASLGAVRAQAPSAPNSPQNLHTTATEENRKNSEALSKVELPMSVEPAFQFKA